MAKQFTLSNSERLKSRKLIENLFGQGKTFAVYPFRIYYSVVPADESRFMIQFGVGVSRKNFKKAVDRNKIKRLTREAYRLQKNNLHEKVRANNKRLLLFFIYTAKEAVDFHTTKEEVKQILTRLIKIVDENNSSDT